MTGKRDIVTFGCRLNAYESEVMRGHLDGLRLEDDIIVVNTCAVTAEAERQARQSIRRLRRDNPDARIVVTGCAAQIDPKAYAAMPEIDRVVGNTEKLEPGTWNAIGAAAGSESGRAPLSRYRMAATIAAPSVSFPTGVETVVPSPPDPSSIRCANWWRKGSRKWC